VVVRVVLQTHVPQSALQPPPRVWFADTPQLLGVLHESDIVGAFVHTLHPSASLFLGRAGKLFNGGLGGGDRVLLHSY
jgi:hypothetical protein